jgi:hypothetical protein
MNSFVFTLSMAENGSGTIWLALGLGTIGSDLSILSIIKQCGKFSSIGLAKLQHFLCGSSHALSHDLESKPTINRQYFQNLIDCESSDKHLKLVELLAHSSTLCDLGKDPEE